ncbi:PhzF family phenazine biosynthesis protein [Streptomyces albipurpureus]|uniref:PhzF family phenazine biosynthesis protein n=1 Tax=Streptomyces albipurpureus TaxID=2897419 RepID=A0ABT0UGX7_9ACTN|nr:PhzF family phenazine biosynthesis protein [Streptomyces sp. CWNU-1]MCM2387689.1 PhzF family phenazine biosynthesis protein [Streptomyces sp. CWNU-1]
MRIHIVDAFAHRPFTGNPAGVMLLDAGSWSGAPGFPEESWMQRVAAEVNLSETAFAHPLPAGGDADWALRWFTPTTEVDMCGHATLATAHVLHSTGAASDTVRFAARCGILTATVGTDGAITLDFPTSPLTPVAVPDGVAEALGAEVLSAHDTGAHIGDLVVELADEAAVRTLTPDIPALAAYSDRGVIATAAAAVDAGQGDGAGAMGRYDFVSRGFFPRMGIDEDPVTGSAHTALAPFWSARLGRTELTGLQASARSGLVHTSLRGERTLLTGRAITVIEGELLVGV